MGSVEARARQPRRTDQVHPLRRPPLSPQNLSHTKTIRSTSPLFPRTSLTQKESVEDQVNLAGTDDFKNRSKAPLSFPRACSYHQPPERDQVVSFEPPDVYHRSLNSGELQCKPRELNKAVCSYSEGWSSR